jgi:hypothetical protein
MYVFKESVGSNINQYSIISLPREVCKILLKNRGARINLKINVKSLHIALQSKY